MTIRCFCCLTMIHKNCCPPRNPPFSVGSCPTSNILSSACAFARGLGHTKKGRETTWPPLTISSSLCHTFFSDSSAFEETRAVWEPSTVIAVQAITPEMVCRLPKGWLWTMQWISCTWLTEAIAIQLRLSWPAWKPPSQILFSHWRAHPLRHPFPSSSEWLNYLQVQHCLGLAKSDILNGWVRFDIGMLMIEFFGEIIENRSQLAQIRGAK